VSHNFVLIGGILLKYMNRRECELIETKKEKFDSKYNNYSNLLYRCFNRSTS